MRTITVYSKPACVQCTQTKNWLDRKGVKYNPHDISKDKQAPEAAKALGYMSAPVVVVNDDGDTRNEKHWFGFRPDLLEEFCKPDPAA